MNLNEARRACDLSVAAYDEPADATVVKVRTAKAIIVRDADCIWVAVEGTRPKLLDWLKNFWTVQTDFLGLIAHSGCVREADLLLPLIKDVLAYDKDKVIKLTGHSQGGGVAPLLAWGLKASGYFVSAGYGFAPMRSIEKKSCLAFNSIFGDRWWRVARESDVVPHLPPAIRYGDVGEGVYFHVSGEMLSGIPSPLNYLKHVGSLLLRKRLPEMWADHDYEKYQNDMNSIGRDK